MGVYDPARHRVLAVDVDILNQPVVVHVFDPTPGPHWSTIAASATPPAQRYLASIVIDPVRDRLLVVGSLHGQSVDVWALTLSGTPTWQQLVTSVDPPGRYGHSTIYDPVHDRVVMFGGMDYSYPTNYLSEVWSLSLATGEWTPMTVSGATPGGREGHGALYDPERQRMLVFGGHYDTGTRGFRNDLWQLSLGDTVAWSEIHIDGPIPGARSAFGTVYDPIGRRMLVHGGVNAQSGIEPDDLWAISLDGTSTWTQILPEDTLRGRSYPMDVYDPVEDRLLACGGAGYPQTSELPLTAPVRWKAVLPSEPLLAPGARSGHAVVGDIRRDRFLVVGGGYSTADSAMWSFSPEGPNHWRPLSTPTAPSSWFGLGYSPSTVCDSLGDRVILFDGWQAWSLSAAIPEAWVPLGPPAPTDAWPGRLGLGAGVAVDTRRNRLIVTGGWIPYPSSAGYTVAGVWSLSLGPEASWSLLGALPQPYGSAGHATFYDPVGDRLVMLGGSQGFDRPLTRQSFGAVVWSSPVDSVLQWTKLGSAGDASTPAPPNAHATIDPRGTRLFIASDSTVWSREVDGGAPWTELASSPPRPSVSSAIAYDPVRDQLLALFAPLTGSDRVDAWAIAVGPMSVSLLGADRSPEAAVLRLRSVAAYGHTATVERREESADWMDIGTLLLDIDGLATFADRDVHPGHDHFYRVSVSDGASTWYSEPFFVPDPGSLRLALLGARPNPATGSIQLAFSLPASGPARLEVFDVRGRRCLTREVGSSSPGTHSIRLDASADWGAGVYYARLRRGGESRTVRMVLVRGGAGRAVGVEPLALLTKGSPRPRRPLAEWSPFGRPGAPGSGHPARSGVP